MPASGTGFQPVGSVTGFQPAVPSFRFTGLEARCTTDRLEARPSGEVPPGRILDPVLITPVVNPIALSKRFHSDAAPFCHASFESLPRTMFVIVIIAVMLLGDFVWWRFCARRLARAGIGWKVGIGAFTTAQAGGMVLVLFTRTSEHGLSFLLTTPVIAGIYVWHFLFIFPMMLVWLPLSVARAISRLARRMSGMKRARAGSTSTAHPALAMTRRDFIGVVGCGAPAILALGATGFALPQLQHFRVRRMAVPIPNLPAALEGLTIAHVTDLHVGQFTHGAILDEIVEATNALRADLVLSTGDLINFALKDLTAGIGVISRLRAEHGVFMCEGNHDLFENAAEFRHRTRAAGIRLLVNEGAVVSIRQTAVQFLGLQWGAGHGDDAIAHSMGALLRQSRPDAFAVLLAHHPHAFDYAEDIPLTLAGHTHGGQLMATGELGCGPMLFRYWSGLYRNENRALVVSNGVGNWFPLRTRAPAEIVHLTLRRG